MAAIFDLYRSGRLGIESKLYQGGARWSKRTREERLRYLTFPSPLPTPSIKSNMAGLINNLEPLSFKSPS